MRWAYSLPVVASAVVLSLVAGCSGAAGPTFFPGLKNPADEEKAEETAPEPACKTASACAGVLKKLVAQKDRSWVGQPVAPEGYQDGTRLFAYRALRKKMTCPEIERAVDETASARSKLSGESNAAVRTLMGKVNTELRAERLARCRHKPKG